MDVLVNGIKGSGLKNHLSQYLVPLYKTEFFALAIKRKISIVAHYKIATLWNGVGAKTASGGFGQIGLIQRMGSVVDVDQSIANGDGFPGQADDPLDIVVFLLEGGIKQYHVTSFGITKPVVDAGADDAAGLGDSIRHRTGGDLRIHQQKVFHKFHNDSMQYFHLLYNLELLLLP